MFDNTVKAIENQLTDGAASIPNASKENYKSRSFGAPSLLFNYRCF